MFLYLKRRRPVLFCIGLLGVFFAHLAKAQNNSLQEENRIIQLENIVQSGAENDSIEVALNELINGLGNDDFGSKARLYSILGQHYFNGANYEKTCSSFLKARNALNKTSDIDQLSTVYRFLGLGYASLAEFDLGYAYYDSVLQIAPRAKGSIVRIKTHLGIGNLWQMDDGNEENALKSYRSGLRLLDSNTPLSLKVSLVNGIANVYNYLDVIDSASYYYRIASGLYKKDTFLTGEVYILANIGVLFLEANRLDSSEYYFNQAKLKSESLYDLSLQAALSTNLNELYIRLNEPEKGFLEIEKVLKLASELDIVSLTNLYERKADYYRGINENDSALKYYLICDNLKDSINQSKEFLRVQELEAEYSNEKLRSEKIAAKAKIEKAEAENKMLILTALALAALAALTGLGLWVYRQKLRTKTLLADKNEVIHAQELRELQKAKQIDRMAALIEGQENERTRVASELHDSIGALLATLSHHFQVIEVDLGADNLKYQKAYSLLKKSSKEVRRLSHNLASNVLNKFGLVAALNDLTEEINGATTSVTLQVIGLEERLDSTIEKHLFRVVQELIGNALKHAEATKISIQIIQHDDELNLMVEDNGVGFNPLNSEKDSGMGMANMKARIEHLNGEFEIDSSIGKGTTAIVNIPML